MGDLLLSVSEKKKIIIAGVLSFLTALIVLNMIFWQDKVCSLLPSIITLFCPHCYSS
jgi:uncharacterized membrane protein YhhN